MENLKQRIRNGSFGEEDLAETDRIFHSEICFFHNIPVGKAGRESDMDAEEFCDGKAAEGACTAGVSARHGFPIRSIINISDEKRKNADSDMRR